MQQLLLSDSHHMHTHGHSSAQQAPGSRPAASIVLHPRTQAILYLGAVRARTASSPSYIPAALNNKYSKLPPNKILFPHGTGPQLHALSPGYINA